MMVIAIEFEWYDIGGIFLISATTKSESNIHIIYLMNFDIVIHFG